MSRNIRLNASLFLFTSLASSSALAVTVPTSAQPSRVEQQLQIEDTRPAVGGESVITVPDESGTNKHLKNDVTFKLKGIVIENQTAFPKSEIEEDYSAYIGKEVTLGVLNDIASKITAHYRNAGYILSRAIVPPQSIKDGIVTIRIVEGYVNKVVFEGAGDKTGLLNQYADKIRNAKPLDAATLERYLLLMQDLPGISVHAVLRPSPGAPGASDVVITVEEKKVDGSVSVDNRGTRYLGPIQGGLTAALNDVVTYNRTQIHMSTTSDDKELQFFQIEHDEQLDDEGTKLALFVGHTHTHPDYRLSSLDVGGVDNFYSAQVSHPFIRSRQTNWYSSLDFDIRNTSSSTLGTPIYRDELHVLRFGNSYDFVDRFAAVNRLNGQLSKGFGWDDDGQPNVRSRIDGRTNFYKGTADASRLQPISGPFSLYVTAKGQMASNELLTAEQFGLGGADFGSAYDPSELTGDAGWAGRAELQYSRYGDLDWLPSYQFYGFYDGGEVWTRNPGAGSKNIASLASAGGGVRFNIMAPLSGDLEVAVPLTKEVAANSPNNGNDARVFFSLIYRY